MSVTLLSSRPLRGLTGVGLLRRDGDSLAKVGCSHGMVEQNTTPTVNITTPCNGGCAGVVVPTLDWASAIEQNCACIWNWNYTAAGGIGDTYIISFQVRYDVDTGWACSLQCATWNPMGYWDPSGSFSGTGIWTFASNILSGNNVLTQNGGTGVASVTL